MLTQNEQIFSTCFPGNYPELARKRAEELYTSKNFNCAESAFFALLEACGKRCSPEAMAMLTGLGGGIGRSGCACGALLGCVIGSSWLLGNIVKDDSFRKDSYRIAKSIHDAFRLQNKVTCCRILSKGFVLGSKEQKCACAVRTADIVGATAQIILDQLHAGACRQEAQHLSDALQSEGNSDTAVSRE